MSTISIRHHERPERGALDHVRALAAAFSASARERLRYPGDALGFGLFLVMLLYTFTQLWRAAASGQGGSVGGWLPAQLVLYLLVTEIVTMSPGHLHGGISQRIRSGDVSIDLLRPTGWVPWELARAAGAAAVRAALLVLFGVPTLILLVGVPRLDPRGIVVGLLVLTPLAILLDCCARLLIGLLAFWFEEATPFFWIWQKLCFTFGGLMLPLDLYPDWLRAIAECLPFAAILFGPAKAVVAFDAGEALRAGIALVAWLAVAALLLAFVHGRASRRLQLNGG